jgi:hypothetical protein
MRADAPGSLPPGSGGMLPAIFAAHGATRSPVPLYYDFGGLPQRYYQLAHPAPGAPALARRIAELIAGGGGGAAPLLAGKPAVLVIVRGGAYGEGTPVRDGTTPPATCGASSPMSGVPR